MDPAIRYPVSQPYLGSSEAWYVAQAIGSGQLSQGPRVLQFERDFARWVGADHAIAVMNGTVALHLALAALNVGPGDEVIVPATTYVATANAVMYCGATPVIVDVDAATWCLDPAAVRRALSPRTRAIVPVHLYGQPAALRELNGICGEALTRFGTYLPALIADAAQAHGAQIGATDVSWHADLSTYSFYGNKILTTGEGGMVVTHDPRVAERLRLLRGQAIHELHPALSSGPFVVLGIATQRDEQAEDLLLARLHRAPDPVLRWSRQHTRLEKRATGPGGRGDVHVLLLQADRRHQVGATGEES